ncbi:MAG: hypothetical protein ACOC6R_00775 [Chloroflexota bacterium]
MAGSQNSIIVTGLSVSDVEDAYKPAFNLVTAGIITISAGMDRILVDNIVNIGVAREDSIKR